MFKKKFIYIILAIMFTIVLTACSGNLSSPRNGSYRSEGFISQTWTFSGSNNITLSAAGGLVSTEGTYEIRGNTIYITSSLFGVENTTRYTITEITRNSFFIDGERFTRL